MGNVVAGLCYVVLLTVAGEGMPLTVSEHPWGQFQPKSWCIVRTTVISNLDGRLVRSAQTVRTTLQSIDGSGISLQEEETLEVGGKIIKKQPQTVKYDFFQEPIREDVLFQQGTPARLKIEKKVVPCNVRIYERQTAGGLLTTTVYYTPLVYPYVLRVEKVLRSSPDDENTAVRIVHQSTMHVQETSALKNPRSSRRIKTYSMQTIEKAGNITKITDTRCSWDVPGGLIESTTREFDAQDKEFRRSVSRMTNFFSYSLIPPVMPRLRPWGVPADTVETTQ